MCIFYEIKQYGLFIIHYRAILKTSKYSMCISHPISTLFTVQLDYSTVGKMTKKEVYICDFFSMLDATVFFVVVRMIDRWLKKEKELSNFSI